MSISETYPGRVTQPYDWDPNTIPISIFRVGRLFILNVPSEFTTMAGRRLRKAVRTVLVAGGIEDPVVTIAGLANSYTHYVTTHEEYGGQRYEAASTLYGPHTLGAYIQEFKRITSDLVQNTPTVSGAAPKDLSKQQISLLAPVGFDTIGWGRKFGSVSKDARDQYVRGYDTVVVSFRSANPRNNQRIEGTFLTVDYLDGNGDWKTRYVDGDWCTRFYWKSGLSYFGASFAEIHWTIPRETTQGLYRICHYGTRKTLLGAVELTIYHAPDWLKNSIIGSSVVSMALHGVELAIALSGRLQRFANKLGHSRLADFENCSRTFLVRA
jgi:neutral ceramidase